MYWKSSGVLKDRLLNATSNVYLHKLTPLDNKHRPRYGRTAKCWGLHHNAHPHTTNQTKNNLSTLSFDALCHPPYGFKRFSLILFSAAFLAETLFNDAKEVKNFHNHFYLFYFLLFRNSLYVIYQRVPIFIQFVFVSC